MKNKINLGNSSEPLNDDAQPSPLDLQCDLSVTTGMAPKNAENHRRYKCWAHSKLSFLEQNMLYMQHHFLCNISYVVIAASMGNSLK